MTEPMMFLGGPMHGEHYVLQRPLQFVRVPEKTSTLDWLIERHTGQPVRHRVLLYRRTSKCSPTGCTLYRMEGYE